MKTSSLKYILFTSLCSVITGIPGMLGSLILFGSFFKTATSDWFWLLLLAVGLLISGPLSIVMAKISLEVGVIDASKVLYKYFFILTLFACLAWVSQGIVGGNEHSLAFSHGWFYLYLPVVIGSLGGGIAFLLIKIFNKNVKSDARPQARGA